MAIVQLSNPPVEPVTLAEIKLHCRIDHDEEDDLLNTLIATARQSCEIFTGRAFVERSVMYARDRWPSGRIIKLPRPPVQDVALVQYVDNEGNTETLTEGDDYLVDTMNEPAAIILPNNIPWPTDTLYAMNPIRITYTAGYPMIPGTPDDYTTNIPDYIKAAIKLCVGNWYEHREAVLPAGHVGKELPMGIQYLLWHERVFWNET